MHYADLSPCDCHPGGYDSASWRAPFLSIGWLESSHEFNRGTCDKSVLEKLRGFVPLSRSKYSHLRFRGVHHCSICETDTSDLLGIGWSQEMLIVPGEGVVYAAPSGIVHYIESHGYLPPAAFTAAVKHCPEYGSDDYRRHFAFLTLTSRLQSLPQTNGAPTSVAKLKKRSNAGSKSKS